MTKATGPQAVLALAVVGPDAMTEPLIELVHEAIFACGVPKDSYSSRGVGSMMIVDLSVDDGLFALPEQLLSRLPGGVQMKLILADRDDKDDPFSMLGAPELADQLRRAGAPVVTAFVTYRYVHRRDGYLPSGYAQSTIDTGTVDIMGYLHTIFVDPGKAVLSMAIVSDISAVTGHADATVRLWDLTTGTLIDRLQGTGLSAVRAIAVTGDGTQIMRGDPEVSELPDNAVWLVGDDLIALAVRPGTREYAVAYDTGRIVARSNELTAGQTAPAVALAATQSTVFTGGDAVIRRWPWQGDQRLAPLSGHSAQVRALATDGAVLVSGGYDRLIIQWDAETGQELRRSDAGIEVQSLAIAPNGRWLVSGHTNGTLRRWDLATGSLIGTSPNAHQGDVNTVAVTPNGEMIISGGADGVLRRWDAVSGEPISGTHAVRQQLPDVVSDIESATDALGVTADVRTIATVLAAASTKPPLSVALLGDWGAGKSSFMCQLRNEMVDLAHSDAVDGEGRAYVSNLRQVTFNAWHYSDDHLWVGLIEQIFRELRATPPAPADPGRVHDLEEQLGRDAAKRDRIEQELHAVQQMDTPVGKFLAPLQSGRLLRGLWSWRGLIALLVFAAGIAAVVVGQQFLGTVIAAAGVATGVWNRVGQKVAATREALQADKAKLDKEIETTKAALVELDPARRLDRLLAEITAEDRYADFRGLTGRIHHDLRRLSADLATTAPAPLQRIVLYVDDLDRCTPARVVDVLQAVNLLLTMDLFMVVVAVDPRWLLRSLERHHSGLFDPDVGPVVYLDKIFHIPFALRPMGNRAVGYLRSLLPDVEVEPTSEPVPSAPQRPSTTAPPTEAPSFVQASGTTETLTVPPPVTTRGLRVTAKERDFLSELTPLLTTPRAIKKLTNLYRLLRLSVPRNALRDFLDGEYQAAALLLTALAGTPNETRALFDQLTTTDFADILKTNAPLPQRLATLVDTLGVDQPAHVYRRWAAEIARFGFTTYDLYPG